MGIIQDKVSSSIIIISIVLKMYYNGYNDYNDIYELDLGENPSLKFKYYDVTNGAFVIGITTTLVRSTLNVNEKGYYYRLYHATDNNIYNLDFRIVFKVGDPVDGEARVPQEHIRYNHDSTWEDQLISYGEIVYIDGVPQTETTIQEYTYDSQGNPIAITNFQYGGYTSISAATLSWSGRELTSIYIPLTQGDSITIEYTYNDQGYRIKKVITSNFDSQISMETIEYELIEDKVIYETNGTYGILFTYDYDGTLISFDYD
ncbi:MAG: hypothetical protein WCX25_05760, partial [Candidatus Izemoplasmatales bacterium]